MASLDEGKLFFAMKNCCRSPPTAAENNTQHPQKLTGLGVVFPPEDDKSHASFDALLCVSNPITQFRETSIRQHSYMITFHSTRPQSVHSFFMQTISRPLFIPGQKIESLNVKKSEDKKTQA